MARENKYLIHYRSLYRKEGRQQLLVKVGLGSLRLYHFYKIFTLFRVDISI